MLETFTDETPHDLRDPIEQLGRAAAAQFPRITRDAEAYPRRDHTAPADRH
jgi:hypothetical protein